MLPDGTIIAGIRERNLVDSPVPCPGRTPVAAKDFAAYVGKEFCWRIEGDTARGRCVLSTREIPGT